MKGTAGDPKVDIKVNKAIDKYRAATAEFVTEMSLTNLNGTSLDILKKGYNTITAISISLCKVTISVMKFIGTRYTQVGSGINTSKKKATK